MGNLILGYRKYLDERYDIHEHELGIRFRRFFVGITWTTDVPFEEPSELMKEIMKDLPPNPTPDDYLERLVKAKREAIKGAMGR